jgi:hypothetical protein
LARSKVSERGSILVQDDEDGYLGEASMQFSEEGGDADAEHWMGGDDEAEAVGEIWLLDEAQGIGGIGNTDDVEESLLDG